MTKGIFITFEGPEGAGKTTQIALLEQYLTDRGRQVLRTREPGGTPLAEQMRGILKHHHSAEQLTSQSELLLMECARSQHIDNVVLPALDAGKIVLCDRFTDSTLAYQGYAGGGDLAFIAKLNDYVAARCPIDRTLIFDLPIEVGFARAQKRTETQNNFDRFEQQNHAFHERVRQGFLAIAAKEPKRVKVVDATQTVEELQKQILEVLHDLF